ncbi:hypothetical protein KAW18_03845 [candidate division WOR-3 bacterium]|nr:hypothetical protein [candidate division WOR-3 bacterium]
MKHYTIILNITIEKLVERIQCKSDIVVTTIIKVFKFCCNEIFEYLEKDDVKVKGEIEDDIIHIQVLMENHVYSRRLGKYVKDQQRKILDDLCVMIRAKLEKIDWKKVLKKETNII